VRTAQSDHGLLTVTFPNIDQILPLSDRDIVLETWGLGRSSPAPLLSGSQIDCNYPRGMQFSAMIGSNLGLYVAEQDPTAAVKTMSWVGHTSVGTTQYTVAHPVLNWGADKPVREYELPGDAVIGPFAGDWFDAAQIYRKWAVTAPWAGKGPIHQREDYPDWLKKAPYFTFGYLGNEHEIAQEREKHAFYDVPSHVAHTYNYYIMLHQDDKYPEHNAINLSRKSLFYQCIAHHMTWLS
jgi:hypothetical protein